MATGFAVAVKIVDLATAPLANINRSIVSLQKNATQVARQGGLFEARDALRRIGDQAKEVGEGLAKVFSPLGGLTAAGSIAGLALLAERFARTGSEIGRTSAAIGLSTGDLQKWRGAADLAGVGAEAMTSSIQGAAHGIYLMRNGLNPDMFRVVQRWGLDANKGATDAEKAANLILQVSDKIRNDPSLRNNAQAQRTLLGQLGIDERMLWLMQQGKEKIEEFAEASRRHAYLTQEQTNQAMELQFAYNGLQQSVGGFTNAVAAEMSKWMTPTIKGFTEWLDKLKESPAAMKTVTVAAEALAAVFGVTLVAGLARLTVALNSIWALPLIRFLVANPAVAGVIAGLWAAAPTTANAGENEAIKAHPELYPRPKPVHRRHGDIFRGVPEDVGPGEGILGRIWDSIGGVTKGAWNLARNAIAGIESGGVYNTKGGSSGRFSGKYQFGADEIAETARELGEPTPTREQFLRDPKMQERYMERYTQEHDRYLMEHSAKYRGLSGPEKLAVLGYAHNQGAEGAVKWLETGKAGRDAFGTSGTAYSDAISRSLTKSPMGPPIPTAAQPAGGGGGPQSMNLDSSHRVEVAFVNAPSGMRSGLTKAEGPAEVSVRTHYSMDGLS